MTWKTAAPRRRAGPPWRLLAFLLLAAARGAAAQSAAPNPVTEWTLLADTYGRGSANWHTLAVMHQAMHDALNAALPLYARWSPPDPDEPKVYDAIPQAAMAAAARQVLLALHPEFRFDTERVYQLALARLPDNAARADGVRLGDATGLAAVRRRSHDGFDHAYLFPTSPEPGRWRPVPPSYVDSYTTSARPFLFSSRAAVPGRPPPPPGSEMFLRDVAETRRLGGIQLARPNPGPIGCRVLLGLSEFAARLHAGRRRFHCPAPKARGRFRPSADYVAAGRGSRRTRQS